MADSFNTPTSELKEESGELKSSESKLSVQKTPTAAEIEEFFASVEKTLHKSFQDKYNYDIVNDVPKEGHFEWIQLKP